MFNYSLYFYTIEIISPLIMNFQSKYEMKNTFVFYGHNSVFTFDQRNFGIVDKLPTIICLVYDVANAFLPIHSNFKWVHKATWINKSVSWLL